MGMSCPCKWCFVLLSVVIAFVYYLLRFVAEFYLLICDLKKLSYIISNLFSVSGSDFLHFRQILCFFIICCIRSGQILTRYLLSVSFPMHYWWGTLCYLVCALVRDRLVTSWYWHTSSAEWNHIFIKLNKMDIKTRQNIMSNIKCIDKCKNLISITHVRGKEIVIFRDRYSEIVEWQDISANRG